MSFSTRMSLLGASALMLCFGLLLISNGPINVQSLISAVFPTDMIKNGNAQSSVPAGWVCIALGGMALLTYFGYMMWGLTKAIQETVASFVVAYLSKKKLPTTNV